MVVMHRGGVVWSCDAQGTVWWCHGYACVVVVVWPCDVCVVVMCSGVVWPCDAQVWCCVVM